MDTPRAGPLVGASSIRRWLPFVVIAALATVGVAAQENRNTVETLLAGLGLVVVSLSALVLPWHKMPRFLQAVPPLLLFLVIAALRDASGGAISSVSAIAILPTLWFALHGSRRQLIVSLCSCLALFTIPALLVGEPKYPLGDIVRGLVVVAISAVIGWTVQNIVRAQRSRVRNTELLRVLSQSASTPTVLAKACETTAILANAKTAVIFELSSKNRLVCTASTHNELVDASITANDEPSGTWIAFKSNERYLVSNIFEDATSSRRLAALVGIRSAVFEPLPGPSGPTGVLVVGFENTLRRLDTDVSAALSATAKEVSWALQRSRYAEQLDVLTTTASDIITLSQPDGEIRYISASIDWILGYNSDEFPIKHPGGLADIAHPDDAILLKEFRAALVRGEVAEPVTFRARHSNGTWVWLETVSRIFKDPDSSEIRQICDTSRDVTERKRSEELVQAANERAASVLNAATRHSIIRTDTNGLINVFNIGAERMLGYRADDVIGKRNIVELHDPVEIRTQAAELGVESSFDVITPSGKSQRESSEWTYITKTGAKVPVSLTVSPTNSTDGTVDGFIAIAVDISERNAALAELRSSLEREKSLVSELRELDESKQELTAAITHDLKTPLTSISAYAEMLVDDRGALDARHRKAVDVIDRNCKRLVQMIDEILKVARMNQRGVHPLRDDIELRSLIASISETMRPVAQRGQIEFVHKIPDSNIFAVGNPGELERAIGNLVSNAIKFTKADGLVSLELTVGDGTALIAVTDTGIGIPDLELESIFEQFHRGANAVEDGLPGSGIGLSAAKQIVEQHNGSLSVVSKLGVGTTFTVVLPVNQ